MIAIVRAVQPLEFEAVATLAREIWTGHYVPIIGQAQVDYMLDRFQTVSAIIAQVKEGALYYLVKEGPENLGYFAVVPNAAEAAVQLSKIYVREDQRGRGLGRKIVAFLEAYCADGGFRDLWLTVNRNNAGSLAFYERMGFQNTGTQVMDIGGGFVMDDYRMTRRLSAN